MDIGMGTGSPYVLEARLSCSSRARRAAQSDSTQSEGPQSQEAWQARCGTTDHQDGATTFDGGYSRRSECCEKTIGTSPPAVVPRYAVPRYAVPRYAARNGTPKAGTRTTVTCSAWSPGASCPAPLVRAARGRLVRVARTHGFGGPGP